MKGSGIEKADGCAAVALDQVFAVLRQSPAFVVVIKGAQQAKAEAIVNKSNVRQPGELNQSAAPIGQAFGKVLVMERRILQHASRLKIDHAQ